jgi:hypothetical protein
VHVTDFEMRKVSSRIVVTASLKTTHIIGGGGEFGTAERRGYLCKSKAIPVTGRWGL